MTKKPRLTELQKTVGSILILGLVIAGIVLLLKYVPAQDSRMLTGVPTAVSIDGGATVSRHFDELAAPVATIDYRCADGKTFMARVEVWGTSPDTTPGHAEVFLNDGSKLLLTQTRSASGVRYANGGESFVFWMKGQTAFIEEGGGLLYADCIGKQQ